MLILKELVSVLTPKRIRYAHLLTKQLSEDTKIMKLYKGLQSGEIIDDDSAITHLYGEEEVDRTKFSKLKYFFKRRLVNTILLIDIDDVGSKKARKKAFFDCLRTFVVAYFLVLLNARAASIQLLVQKLKTMEKYDFTFLALESAKLLRQHFSVIDIDPKKSKIYSQKIQTYSTIYFKETEIEGYYYELIQLSKLYEVGNEIFTKSSENLFFKSKEELPVEASSALIYKQAMIEIIYLLNTYEYLRCIEACREAIERLEQKYFDDVVVKSGLYFQQVSCYLQLRDLKSCQSVIESIASLLVKGDKIWFGGKLMMVKIAMHNSTFEEARMHLVESLNHKNFSSLNESLKEEWSIHEAYLNLLALFDEIDKVVNKNYILRRTYKLVNDLPLSQKDKGGLNIAILVYQLMILAYEQNYKSLEERKEATLKYRQRYLRGDTYKRTRLFLSTIFRLNRLVSESTQPSQTEINKLLDNFEQKSLKDIRSSRMLEIVPYEVLLKLVVKRIAVIEESN